MENIEKLLTEMIEMQRKKLYLLAKKIIPYITMEDLLQPNDFPQLEGHPHFRHEEGHLQGLLGFQAALLAMRKED